MDMGFSGIADSLDYLEHLADPDTADAEISVLANYVLSLKFTQDVILDVLSEMIHEFQKIEDEKGE